MKKINLLFWFLVVTVGYSQAFFFISKNERYDHAKDGDNCRNLLNCSDPEALLFKLNN